MTTLHTGLDSSSELPWLPRPPQGPKRRGREGSLVVLLIQGERRKGNARAEGSHTVPPLIYWY